MDIDYQKDTYTPSHYEVVAVKDPVNDLKQVVFQSMKLLHGWCSDQKASILMDMIFLTKPDKVVEIGVWGGKSLVPMAFAVKMLGKGHVYGIDPWKAEESIVGWDDVNKEWWGNVDHEGVYQHLLQKINEFGLKQQISLVRLTSEQAEPLNEIGLLHIDGNHSEESALFDVIKWVPHVKRGGVVVFDDVDWSSTGLAVSWLNENCVPITLIKGDNIWGIWIKP